ncbi:bifunctional 2-polyprenyl-6-hydroxyphenol methylase/3-demethylubiquinol 3-O-methyltransferase UbiG [Micromonospora sp. HUAS LYJ1]|uniref:class I SAM-dependent methyltransferase n=1 Tax=Micromonospora sp. HUAS LYJ1 TaxID=3061626 RepID=UPI002672E685|nr:class I SAM-dependent methyltransferase [Micromonospora sp. HUAS LYJ1]WKU04451.1 class I SAM-dependent methyltransferase [Micromonospora sp. HUAS LYJ1]
MTIDVEQHLAKVREYYHAQRSVDGSPAGTIYAIWEQGKAFNDSVTPSTYVPEYRSHMALKLLSLTPQAGSIFSLGCGNGFVEGDLVALERTVRAIDCNDEAVTLARRRGIDAFAADYFDLRPADVAGTDLIYADGFLGHVFTAEEAAAPALTKLAELGLRSGTYVVISNDAPHDPKADYAPHERVAGFWFVSRDYLNNELTRSGFVPVESYYFPYLRPVSGLRNRTICIARVP